MFVVEKNYRGFLASSQQFGFLFCQLSFLPLWTLTVKWISLELFIVYKISEKENNFHSILNYLSF